MKRFHVHISVDNLADSVKFYSGMFGSEPTELKPDYAKWKLEDPRINFAISRRGAKVGLDHIGIQVENENELEEMQARLNALQPGVELEEGTTCCYAKSDKYWVKDPAGIAWETFHTLESIPVFGMPAKKAGPIAINIPVASAKSELASSCCAPGDSEKQGSSCC
ncbi:ArsI/CadI family heavy metal resistance metalloenzyme [Oxalobacteraceae bacterium R-40]|uniref:ArsI/CadI family heavy metal resistance metalloenzyme n=1 Tax=Keguizhuia sedimenti TaxID=3064264 RepID=A0ABU1BNF2_9BURK|nr:ArsI/CadI family heavy metal resistance metalloenzyme [Oxalobacteraceae bacterium R-40]